MDAIDGPTLFQVIYGFFYSFLGFSMVLVNILCARVYARYPDYRSRICYRILLSCCICDIMQLIAHGYGGLILMTGTNFHPSLEKVLGALINANSLVLWAHQVLLAINRFVVVRNVKEKSPASQNRLFFILFFVAWSPILLFGVYLSPFCGIVFVSEVLTWDYADLQWSPTVKLLDFSVCNSCCAAAFLFYFGVLIALIQNKRLVNDRELRHALSIRERQVLIQSFATFAGGFIGLTLWYFGPSLFALNPYLIGINTATWVWINSGNSVLYLWMNRHFRQRFCDVAKRALGLESVISDGSSITRVSHTIVTQSVMVRPGY